jgi:hydrogenase expression/formation protein HypE
MPDPENIIAACPVPSPGGDEQIVLAHGEGGRLMRRLLEERLLRPLANPVLDALGDAAQLPALSGKLALTTDSFVVSPLFFPGGDIGSLAVFGTVNDLVVAGAEPICLSLSFILEEGLPLATLDRVLASICAACQRANVFIATGDTKVVPSGAADKLFINTTGLGHFKHPPFSGPASLQTGDEILITGPIGQHGIAVLVAREELGFDPPPTSDCAPLYDAVAALRRSSAMIRAMRDATRGGVTAVLHEWARACGLTIAIDEDAVPVSREVRAVCELLGLDPLHVANEGTMVVAVAAGHGDTALEALRDIPGCKPAARIGTVRPQCVVPVVVRGTLGRERPLDEPLGAPLPRIC